VRLILNDKVFHVYPKVQLREQNHQFMLIQVVRELAYVVLAFMITYFDASQPLRGYSIGYGLLVLGQHSTLTDRPPI
jgi:hypothetical protein